MARYYMWTWASGIITIAHSYSKAERKEKEKEYGKLISKKFHGYYKKQLLRQVADTPFCRLLLFN